MTLKKGQTEREGGREEDDTREGRERREQDI